LYCYESLTWSESVYDCNYVTLWVFNEMITSSLKKKKKKFKNLRSSQIVFLFFIFLEKKI